MVALLIFNASYFTYQYVKEETPVYHEIYASKGEKLVVLLGDGSRVWLNADSKLIYPEHFTGGERRVSLIGEAYFEVKKTLDACGFEWTQGSVYVSKEDKDNLATVYRAINALTKLDWFKKSVRDIRAFKVEDWSDFTAIVRES